MPTSAGYVSAAKSSCQVKDNALPRMNGLAKSVEQPIGKPNVVVAAKVCKLLRTQPRFANLWHRPICNCRHKEQPIVLRTYYATLARISIKPRRCCPVDGSQADCPTSVLSGFVQKEQYIYLSSNAILGQKEHLALAMLLKGKLASKQACP